MKKKGSSADSFRMFMMKCTLFVVIGLPVFSSAQADNVTWTTHTTNTHAVYTIDVSNSHVWCGVLNTGIERWDLSDGSHILFTAEDGVPGEQFHDICIGENGYVWVGTDEGLCRFDGIEWTVYTTEDGLFSNDVHVVAADSGNIVWIGYGPWAMGATRLDTVGGMVYSEVGKLAEENVFTMYIDDENVKHFGTRNGIFSFNDETWTVFSTEDGLANRGVSSLVKDKTGTWWYATYNPDYLSLNAEISCYDGETMHVFNEPTDVSVYRSCILKADNSGNIWAGSLIGLWCYNGYEWRKYSEADGMLSQSVHSLAVADDDLFTGTSNGMSKFDGESFLNYSGVPCISYKTVNSIAVDKNNRKWFATSCGGISVYDGVSWITLKKDQGLATNYLDVICIDRKGRVWVGASSQHGISCFDGEKWTVYTAEDCNADLSITAMAVDKDNTVWFGTFRSGLISYDGDRWETYTIPEWYNNNKHQDYCTINAVAVDHDNNVWIGTQAGATRYDGREFITYSTNNGLANNIIKAIAVDHDNNIWIGSHLGAMVNNGVEWTHYQGPLCFGSDRITAITVGPDNAIWFGTDKGGISRFDNKTWTRYTKEDGLVYDKILSIAADQDNVIWIGTSYGVSELNTVTVDVNETRDITPSGITTNVFPNPFNASTTIEYTIPTPSDVRLTVYSITGQRVATLEKGSMPAGRHAVIFDGSDMSSGLYYYRLETGKTVTSGKMLMVK